MENKKYSNSDHNNATSYRSIPEQFVKTMFSYVKRSYLSREELSSQYEELEEQNEDESQLIEKLATITTDYEEEIDEEIKLSESQFTTFEHLLTQWVDIIVALRKISQQHILENKKEEHEHEEADNKNMCIKENSVLDISTNSNEQIRETEMQNNTTKLHKIYDVDEITDSQSTKNNLFSLETSNAGWLFANLNNVVNAHMSFAHQSILPTPWSQVNVTDAKITSLFNSIARLCHLYSVLHLVKTVESKMENKECEQLGNEISVESLIASLRHFAKQCSSEEEQLLNESNETVRLNLSQFISMWVNAICENIKIEEETDQGEQKTSSNIHNNIDSDILCIIELHAKLIFFELLRLSPKTDSNVQENRANAKNCVSFLYLERALKYYAINVFQSRRVKSNMKCEENTKEQTSIPINQDIESCISCNNNNNNNNKRKEMEKLSVGILYGLALHYPMHMASSLNNNNKLENNNHNYYAPEQNRKVKAERTTCIQKRKRKRIDDSDDDDDDDDSDSDTNDVIEEIVIDEAYSDNEEHKHNVYTNSENLRENSKGEINSNKSFEIDLRHSRWRWAQRWRNEVIKQRAISHKEQNRYNANKSKVYNRIHSISTPINTKQTNPTITVLCGQSNSCNKCRVNVNITNYDVEVASGILTCYDNIYDNTKIEKVREYYVHNATVHWYTQGSVTTDNYGSNSMQVEKLLLQRPTRTKSEGKQHRFDKRRS